jgi:hypothetical protein
MFKRNRLNSLLAISDNFTCEWKENAAYIKICFLILAYILAVRRWLLIIQFNCFVQSVFSSVFTEVIYVPIHFSQNVCKHGKFFGVFRISRHIGQVWKSVTSSEAVAISFTLMNVLHILPQVFRKFGHVQTTGSVSQWIRKKKLIGRNS